MTDESSKEDSSKSELERFINSFSKSRESFERLSAWGLAISSGTLLWFIGNFDKFAVSEANNSQTLFMPYKLPYILTAISFAISSLVFAIICARLYYTKYTINTLMESFYNRLKALRQKEDEQDSIWGEYRRFRKLKEPEESEAIKKRQYEQLQDDINEMAASLNNEKEKLLDKSAKANEFVDHPHADLVLKIGALFYIIGLILGSSQLILFIYNYM